MSRTVSSVPSRGAYPWDQWFNGATHELTRGEDFWCNPHNFRGTVVYAAGVRGVELELFKVRQKRLVYLKAKGGSR